MYKVGDKVKITGNSNSHEFNIGEIVVVKSDIDRDNDYDCSYLDGNDGWYVNESDMELVEEDLSNFKVKCVDLNDCNYDSYTVGKVYEIINGNITDDKGCNIGIDCTTFAKWQSFSSSKFELVEDAKVIEQPKYKEVHRRAKVGEKVKIISEDNYKNGNILTTVEHENGMEYAYYADADGCYLWDEEYVVLEPINENQITTKSELQDGDIIEIEDGTCRVYFEGYLFSGKSTNLTLGIGCLHENMSSEWGDISKVTRNGEIIFQRKSEKDIELEKLNKTLNNIQEKIKKLEEEE